jgi:hypothetical protein
VEVVFSEHADSNPIVYESPKPSDEAEKSCPTRSLPVIEERSLRKSELARLDGTLRLDVVAYKRMLVCCHHLSGSGNDSRLYLEKEEVNQDVRV